MSLERQELSDNLKFQESLLRLVAVNRRDPVEDETPRRPVAAEKIAEMARKVAQRS